MIHESVKQLLGVEIHESLLLFALLYVKRIAVWSHCYRVQLLQETWQLGIVLNSLRSTLVALLAENSLNSLSTRSKRACES